MAIKIATEKEEAPDLKNSSDKKNTSYQSAIQIWETKTQIINKIIIIIKNKRKKTR